MTAIGFTSAFALLYLSAPLAAEWFGRPWAGPALRAQCAGPLLLFSFPVVTWLDPRLGNPWPIAMTLIALIAAVAWRAIATRTGALYYIGAFFAIATQAVWSARHLTLERLTTAVALYVAFGLVSLGVLIVARRLRRPLEPAWAGGVVLPFSLALPLFSLGPVAPAALWALALLVAIMNAGLCFGRAGGRRRLVLPVGSVLSWFILAVWWSVAAGSVGAMPSLTVVVGLTLLTLGGHGWSVRFTRDAAAAEGATPVPATFVNGAYLGLIGYLFLFLLAMNREWAGRGPLCRLG